MKSLENYGWNDFFKNQQNTNGFKVGRVISIQGIKFQLATGDKDEFEAEVSGKLMYGSDPELMPCVGDWIYYIDYGTQGYIVDVFARRNTLSRKNPGNRTERQIMAANIDYALIVQGLDRDFNIMRLDRYIVQIIACGIEPVIILNKEDLIEDRQPYIDQISRLKRDCRIHFCSTINTSGISEIYSHVLKPQKTHILIGSSGAGKSSLLNALMKDLNLRTGEISSITNKGKHTTTSRELFQISNGSLVIDTPGMREFGLALEEVISNARLFPAIDLISERCRFNDCSHLTEEGCAVIEAYENGQLDSKIYESYLKLVKEQQHFQIKAEDKKRLGKQFGKMVKEAKAYRNKYKY